MIWRQFKNMGMKTACAVFTGKELVLPAGVEKVLTVQVRSVKVQAEQVRVVPYDNAHHPP